MVICGILKHREVHTAKIVEYNNMFCADKKGDIVKLYDLTSLTNEEQSRQNPFRHPLAHLLFRVALKLHKEKDPSKSGIIQALLTNCLALAPEARPQVCCSFTIVTNILL